MRGGKSFRPAEFTADCAVCQGRSGLHLRRLPGFVDDRARTRNEVSRGIPAASASSSGERSQELRVGSESQTVLLALDSRLSALDSLDSMNYCRIILIAGAFVVSGYAWSQESTAPGPTIHGGWCPPRLAPATQATVLPGPPYLQTSPVIQPAPQVVPVFPQQSTVVPLPSQTPGSVFGPPLVTNAPGMIPPPPGAYFRSRRQRR